MRSDLQQPILPPLSPPLLYFDLEKAARREELCKLPPLPSAALPALCFLPNLGISQAPLSRGELEGELRPVSIHVWLVPGFSTEKGCVPLTWPQAWRQEWQEKPPFLPPAGLCGSQARLATLGPPRCSSPRGCGCACLWCCFCASSRRLFKVGEVRVQF